MLAWLAEQGCYVVHIDALDASGLASDPRRELVRSGLDEDTIAYFFEISDFAAEADAIARCRATGSVQFVTRIPETKDIRDGLVGGSLPLVSLDLGTLHGKREGFQGHVLLATGHDPHERLLRLQDPGPPPHWNWDVPESTVKEAMRYPADTSGTVTLISRSQPANWE
jgi:hypothetical protein